jgi:hypothetical protein
MSQETPTQTPAVPSAAVAEKKPITVQELIDSLRSMPTPLPLLSVTPLAVEEPGWKIRLINCHWSFFLCRLQFRTLF